ncbi:unnamed protein product [Dovyalis caffra]|uniref:Uncharacterized protein n=1 Tax=Dovyalis caffra TaxID=77055 RepID=A0AAV1SKK8_9ROSI|nr:unnamed protein product [Dovyalis caffra]
MSLKLSSPFLGIPVNAPLNGRNLANSLYPGRVQLSKIPFRKCMCVKKHSDWVAQAIRFSHFCGKNVELLRNAIGLRNGLRVECVKEPFVQSKALVMSLAPVWKEGLLIVRCSVFGAVISGVCLLVWYGQNRAKGYIEVKLLPSVCSVLSDYIQREIDFGKVRRISPLSVTLESCSIGPHGEEFSCGEVPTMKLQIRPFTSLRRGKIVIDAILSHPSVLVVQKKDYTWLGIPSSEGGLQRHLSNEEGIDFRTKTRRHAREESASQWNRERDVDAKEAAEKGYTVPERDPGRSEDDVPKNDAIRSNALRNFVSFPLMDDKMHWKDHHCMDTGLDYDKKHAHLEKSFGVKFPGSGLKLWSSVIRGPKKNKFKRKVDGSDISAASINAKRRILERSASAAVAYFQGLYSEKSDEPSQSSCAYDVMNLDSLLVQRGGDYNLNISIDASGGDEDLTAKSQNKDSGNQPLEVDQNVHGHIDKFSIIRDTFLSTVVQLIEVQKVSENLPPVRNVSGDAKTNNINDLDLVVGAVNRQIGADDLGTQSRHASQNLTSEKLEPGPATYLPVPGWSFGLASDLLSFSSSVSKLLSHLLAGPFQKIKSGVGPKVEDIVAELVDGEDVVQSEGIEKMLPVSLDSVHFKGGTLLLLAYGDREPREMENVDGHVKFQNHYGRVHVQLSGNCRMWRSGAISEDGGWLSADVFVDIVEQTWHANLKIVNLFAPVRYTLNLLFERILEIPITWSKGRATGEVHLCMSRGETFPNLHGQLDVTGLAFQIYDAPSWFSVRLCLISS